MQDPNVRTPYVHGQGCTITRLAMTFGEPMTRKVFIAFVIYLAAALVGAHAQSNYAMVSGSILDPQHRPIANARVYITASETGAKREVVSNASGLYEIAGLLPGTYTLAVDNHGFKQATQTLSLEVGQHAAINTKAEN